jgi:hypothetical protein
MKTINKLSASLIILLTASIAFGGALKVEFTKTDVTCFGKKNGKIEAFISGGKSPYSIKWNNGSTATIIENIGSGMYSCTITDAAGNTQTESIKIDMPKPIAVSFNSPGKTMVENLNADLDIAITGGTPWKLDNVTTNYMIRLNGQSFYEHPETLQSGVYQLSIEDAAGCKFSFNTNILVENTGASATSTEGNGLGKIRMNVHTRDMSTIDSQEITVAKNLN